MNLLRRLFRRPDDSLLGLISFDDSNFRRVVTEPDQVEWITPDDDAILLSRAHGEAEFLNKAQSVDEIRKHCGQELYDRHESAEPFVWLFEFGFPTVAGRTCLWTAAKWHMKPSGMLYEGMLTMPFHGRTFVIAMMCPETGITGIRETALMMEAYRNGTMTRKADGSPSDDWNPDAKEYDAQFPSHPVARLRRGMDHIKSTLRLHESLATADRYFFPPKDG